VAPARLLAGVFRNAALRRVELAFAGFNAAEWAAWITMLVYAYEQGGTTTAGIVAAAQLLPAALLAPFAGALADRRSPSRVLALGYAAQTLALAATAAALLAHAPPLAAYVLAAVAATTVTITRPTQAALVPALAQTAEELTAANVVAGWIEAASVLVAPALAGVLLDVSSPGVAFAAAAAFAAGATAAAAGLPRTAPSAAHADDARLDLRRLAREPAPRTLIGVLATQYVAIGALDVLYVVLALSTLAMGEGGAGYLNAAFGAGGVAGVVLTALLVGRRRLAPALALAVAAWALAFAALAARPTVFGAVALLAVAGAARSTLDVAGRTLLQRAVPSGVLARVFGVLEGLSMLGLALGSLLTPVLVAAGGVRAALFVLAALLPAAALAAGRRLLSLDRDADVPVVEIALLRSQAVFAPLTAPQLESLARALVPVRAHAGDVVVERGSDGDRFYVVAGGELDVDGQRTLQRGDGFGEIALLHDVPRTATVRARTDAQLFALERRPFLAAVGRISA
jgi:MFS family permease